MSSGKKSFLTLKISVTSFSRFFKWIFKELSSISNYWPDDLRLGFAQSLENLENLKMGCF